MTKKRMNIFILAKNVEQGNAYAITPVKPYAPWGSLAPIGCIVEHGKIS